MNSVCRMLTTSAPIADFDGCKKQRTLANQPIYPNVSDYFDVSTVDQCIYSKVLVLFYIVRQL